MKSSLFLLFTFLLLLPASNIFADTVDFDREVILTTPTGKLYGTLRTPEMGPNIVALIIAGSGPTDRDGNNPSMQNNSLKMLAEALFAKGIRSLRYDKRGIAKSKDAGLKEQDLRFDDYVNDAVAWAKYLKTEMHFEKVIIIGHSEGSLIGMIAAQLGVAHGYVSIAGAGRPADVIIAEQLHGQPDTIQKASRSIMDSLLMGKTVEKVGLLLYSLFRPSVQPYLISWFKYDPAKEIAKLKIPVLILQGSTDIQVSVKDAQLLSKAQPKGRLVIIDNMNHIFKNAPLDREKNIETYTNPALPIVPQLPEEIVKFIKEIH